MEAMALIEIDGLPNLNMVILDGYVKYPDGNFCKIGEDNCGANFAWWFKTKKQT